MAKRIGPEAKIIALFTALPVDSKRIVLDVIKSQTAPPRKASTKKATSGSYTSDTACIAKLQNGRSWKFCGCEEESGIHDPKAGYGGYHPFVSPVPVAAKKSSRKNAAINSTANTEVETVNATAVGASGD